MTGNAQTVTPADPIYIDSHDHLQAVIDEHDIVVVDFFATWCGPCQMMEPILEEIAAESTAAVAKVDVDQLQALAAEFGVRGVPTLVLFQDGNEVEKQVGALSGQQLRDLVTQYAQ